MATTPPTDSLRMLPQVEETLRAPELRALETIMERSVLADCVREAIGGLRRRILAGEPEGTTTSPLTMPHRKLGL